MAKKINIGDLFKTADMKKEEEVGRAIKQHCLKVNPDNKRAMKEIHQNLVEHFKINGDNKFIDYDNFKTFLLESIKIKQKAKAEAAAKKAAEAAAEAAKAAKKNKAQ